MTARFTESEVIATVTRLSLVQLHRFIEVAFVQPQQGEDGYVFCDVDIARLELLCDLSVDLEMDETALHVVISLIDQLHVARQDLARMARALETLPEGSRMQVAEALMQG